MEVVGWEDGILFEIGGCGHGQVTPGVNGGGFQGVNGGSHGVPTVHFCDWYYITIIIIL